MTFLDSWVVTNVQHCYAVPKGWNTLHDFFHDLLSVEADPSCLKSEPVCSFELADFIENRVAYDGHRLKVFLVVSRVMLGGFQGILDAFGVVFTEKKLHPCLYDILIHRYDSFQFKSMGFHHYFQQPYDPTNITHFSLTSFTICLKI